jgi:glycosyltransferase involved in cell wall biosynthesis
VHLHWNGAGPIVEQEGAAMAKEAVVLTHQLARYLDDFGNVVRYLDADGYKVTVYASVPEKSRSFSADSAENFEHYRQKLPPSVVLKPLPYVRGGKMKPWDVLQLMAVGARLGRKHPDAMFQMWSVYLIIACGVPLRLMNRRSLYMVTGLGPVLGSKGSRFRLFRRIILTVYAFLMTGRNSRCLNHNADDKAFLAKRLRADPAKFFVTPGCGVDPSVFPFHERYAGNPRPVIVMPARLIELKGVREAVAASGILRDRGIDHEMRFTGAVEPHLWIRVTQEEMDAYEAENPCVRFIGFQPSMPAVYEQSDIVCYPTRYPEGTPTVLIEAAASGRAAVTCDTVGAREIVAHGRTGFVVPQMDVEALADALQRLIEDGDLRERFRRSAYEHFIANYTKDMALVATLDAFESVGMTFDLPKSAPDIRVPQPA